MNISLNPDNAIVGSPDTQITVAGTGFIQGSTVSWNGQDRATIFVSATELRFTAPAADLAKAGTAEVRVANPNGSISNPATFTINNPSVTGIDIKINPNEANVGSDEIEITITGNNFVPTSQAQWDGQDRVTTYVSPTELRVRIPASDLKAVKTAEIRVVNPGPGGGFRILLRSTSENKTRIESNQDNARTG